MVCETKELGCKIELIDSKVFIIDMPEKPHERANVYVSQALEGIFCMGVMPESLGLEPSGSTSKLRHIIRMFHFIVL
jgi:hypothetical protein